MIGIFVQSYAVPFDGLRTPFTFASRNGRFEFVITIGHGGGSLPIPYWPFLVPLAAWVLVRWHRRRADRRANLVAGLCPDCGYRHDPGVASCLACGAIFETPPRCPVCKYDLRISPGRCPECGWHTPQEAEAAPSLVEAAEPLARAVRRGGGQ